MIEVVKVGMADLKGAKAPATVITCGLGSCVGIALYDSVAKVGGIAHIMLPDSNQSRNKENPAKFADTAIPMLIQKLVALGALKRRLVAKIAGGAQMFSIQGASDIMRIGDRNVEATMVALKLEGIPILYQDTGGNYGRTIELDTCDGKMCIKTIDKGQTII
ncbi:MAG: chemotaxis protein CheD [Clostridia bacterium]|nr:chemotaxis protein CheD [Clostridia bacterium]